ncbi:general substrate transporter [Amniculicola lignicola CBS 123094]|uniref:General substrate transporter n=1 Tax=Amniculicola lignicola CBS 123094 TaxID=1392246 RepID=A0A6A5WGR4_9PLEO|nr:general substrate transporter [Amniculicola lignicola CBS 123094]
MTDASEALKRFEARQHSLTRKESIKENWKALLWCFYMFFTCIMFGFDSLAGGVVVSIPNFRKDFGTAYAGDYVVDANWQLGFQAATLGGIIFGGLITGFLVNKWGRQPTILIFYLTNTAGIFLQFFSTDVAMFFGGKILTGLPLGCFSTVAPTYASELTPLNLRGSITAGMNFAIVLGQLIGNGVMRESNHYSGRMQYRVLFATQWGYVAVGLLFLPFFPESPYWLVAHGKHEKARKNIAKLHNPDYDVDGHMAQIHNALSRQNADDESQGSLAECFSRKHIKRTMVATSMFFIQNATGNAWVVGYMTYFMQLGGLNPAKSLDVTVGISCLMLVGNMCGWVLVEKVGRRNTALYGTGTLTVTLFLIGILACIKASGAIWGQVVFMAVWSFVYQGTVGASAWPISAETPTSRLRAPTQALATMMNGASSCIWSFSLPYMINPDQGNLAGKVAFIFGAVCVFCTIFIWFFIPETKARTYTEIDELWDRKISARHFERTVLATSVDGKISEP